jgi:hypothetical protein
MTRFVNALPVAAVLTLASEVAGIVMNQTPPSQGQGTTTQGNQGTQTLPDSVWGAEDERDDSGDSQETAIYMGITFQSVENKSDSEVRDFFKFPPGQTPRRVQESPEENEVNPGRNGDDGSQGKKSLDGNEAPATDDSDCSNRADKGSDYSDEPSKRIRSKSETVVSLSSSLFL